MGSIKARLMIALGALQLLTLAMALVLYFGARRMDQGAHQTRRANDEVRELLSFALLAHRYMSTFEHSLGQRTLIANRERRAAAAAFETRILHIESDKDGRSSLRALDWDELRAISSDLNIDLLAADALREQGKFLEAERTFARGRKTHFDERMLPWFDGAIETLRADVDSLETDTIAAASTLRAAALVLGALSALLASVAGFAVTRSILRPVEALVAGTEQLALSNFAYKVPELGKDELALLAKRFNLMADTIAGAQANLVERNTQLEEAYRLQSDFLSIVSHELRSPLHSILGYTELLLEDELALDARGRKNLIAIATSAKRLLALINDILDFSKLKAGHMQARRAAFELQPLLESAIEDARALPRARGVELLLVVPDERIVLFSDREKVTQVLTNLLSNAVKFTEQGSVTLRAAAVTGGAELEVRDTGVGIPPEHLELIFEPFRQAQLPDKHMSGGTGLGLAIVARLVELLGGRVSVESEVGRGTRFNVFFSNAT